MAGKKINLIDLDALTDVERRAGVKPEPLTPAQRQVIKELAQIAAAEEFEKRTAALGANKGGGDSRDVQHARVRRTRERSRNKLRDGKRSRNKP